MSRFPRRPSPSMLVALLALLVAAGVPAQAASVINGALLKTKSVSGAKLKDRTVTGVKLGLGSVSNSRLASNSVTMSKVKNRTLLLDDLSVSAIAGLLAVPGNAVGTAQVADGSLTGADIAENSLGTDDLRTDAVGAEDIIAGGVGTAEIAANSVISAKVFDGSLVGKDVAEFVGTLTDLDFGLINADDCKAVASTSLTAVSGSPDMTDDVVIVTPTASFPEKATVTAKASSANQITVVVCNLTAAQANIGQRSFRFAAIDAG